MDIHIEIKKAKTYQLQICADRMKDTHNDASDNLTANIARDVYQACNEELNLRGEVTI